MTDTITTFRRAKALLDFLALGGWFEASNIQETDEALAAFAIFFEQCDPLTAYCERATKDTDRDLTQNVEQRLLGMKFSKPNADYDLGYNDAADDALRAFSEAVEEVPEAKP